MSSSLIDTRLHVTVRPALEYQLPHAARLAILALVGDVPTEDVLSALSAPPRPTPAHDEDDDDDDNVIAMLKRQSACVCSHAQDYLEELAAHWRSHLTDVTARVRSEVHALASRAVEVDRARELHRDRVDVGRRQRSHRCRAARLPRRRCETDCRR